MSYKIILLLFFLLPTCLVGGDISSDIYFNIWWIIPFLGILLSIALFPLINQKFWHNNFGKVSLFWTLLFTIPFYIFFGNKTFYFFGHAILLEYVPFIVLLVALFTISGGIVIRGNFVGTPMLNIIFLFVGTFLASWMGTTGAAMLLIRPIIKANKWRINKIHIFVFFIFLIGNIGGALTPLGDPPLFIGFLKGVDFFWTTKHMLFPMLFISSFLFLIFYFIDNYFYKKELDKKPNLEPINFSIKGKFNFLLLIGVALSVIFSGIFKDIYIITFLDNNIPLSFIIRDLLLIILTVLSYKFTSLKLRKENEFTWFPIVEVAKLFAGIFITVIPAISILDKMSRENIFDNLSPSSYFWLTGSLSGFLDNAPTYLVFFNAASGDAQFLMNNGFSTLLAISSGAVFMGAMTYIGNAPNFMIKSIVEENNEKMPSFFGYMAWSIIILIPIFLIHSFLFLGV